MCRVLIAGLFTKLGSMFGMNTKVGSCLLKIANYFCEKEYIFTTPFGKYISSSLQEYILMDNNYEPEIGDMIKKVTNIDDKNKYLINIGANIGRRTIDLAKNYGYKVVAIEPAPHTYYSLRCNIALSNLLDEVQTYNIALGNENAQLNFEYRKYHNGSSHIIDDNDIIVAGGEIIKVPVRKFDDLGIGEDIIKNTRLIIMDVEGFELNVIKGMENTLRKLKNINIIMEIWEDKKNKKDTLDFMKSLGYSAKKVDAADWLFSK